jgi:site-specific recombinase XerD
MAENTRKAYAADWRNFERWCRLKGTDPLRPSSEMIGRYLAELAAPGGKSPALSTASIKRRF